MTGNGAAAIRIGDVVRFQDREWKVGGLDSATAYLTSRDRPPAAVTLATLFSDPSFAVITQAGRQRRPLPPTAVFDALAVNVQERARWWEEHLSEVIDGRPCTAPANAVTRPEYDVAMRSTRQREQAKVEELRR